MKTPRFIRTTSFRLTALYAGLFAASSAFLFVIVYWIATDVLYEEVRLSLQSEMAALEAKIATEPPSELAAEITQRFTSGSPQPFYYSLQNPSGQRIAGNLSDLGAMEGWRQLPYPSASSQDSDHKLLALGRRLPNGSFLTIATDTYRIRDLEEAVVHAFAWAAAATLLLAMVGGIALSQGFLRRVDEINRAMRAIIQGDISNRIRTGGTDDEIDQLGRNLNEMLDRLQSLMEGLKQVSNDIAHDLRTPLSRLKQRLEAVRFDARSIRDYEGAIDQALQDANMALSTFGALLRIAQIESGTRRANFSDLDLSALMQSLGPTYAAVAEDSGKTFKSSIDPGLHIRGDRDLLIQMFVNLIENALRHTPDGTRIDMSLRKGEQGPLAEVSDDGPGIPERERGKIFKRFYRLEASRSNPGSGLGLALVAAVADLHGARIELSDNGPGLRVALKFNEEPRS